MNGNNRNKQVQIMRDLGLVAISILVAIILAKTSILTALLTRTKELEFLSSFLAGAFFVSVFTAAPSGVALYEITTLESVWIVSFFGAWGAVMGDLLIFRFIRDGLNEDLRWLMKKSIRYNRPFWD